MKKNGWEESGKKKEKVGKEEGRREKGKKKV